MGDSLFADGFEVNTMVHYQSLGCIYDAGANITTSNAHKDGKLRGGLRCLQLMSTEYFYFPIVATTARRVSIAMYPNQTQNVLTTEGYSVIFQRSGSANALVRFCGDGKVRVLRGSTVVATSTLTFPFNQHHWVNIFMNCDNSGSCIVQMNGVEYINITAVDLTNTATNLWDRVVLDTASGNAGLGCYWDDAYIRTDAQGFAPETFMELKLATSTVSSTGFTAVGEATLHECVDNNPHNTSVYGQGGAIADKMRVAFGALTYTPASVEHVRLITIFSRDGAIGSAVPKLISGGTTATLTSFTSASGAFQSNGQIQATDPDTAAAWSASGVNNVNAEVELAA